jgi:hypothetical protein
MPLPHPFAPRVVALLAGLLGPGGPDDLPAAAVRVDAAARRIVIELPAVDLPAARPAVRRGRDREPGGEAMVGVPLCRVVVPLSASLYSARVEIVDAGGRALPRATLHHFNLTDPDHRELFLPISLHILAASRETPPITIPRLLFGLPLERGQRLMAGAMLANASPVAYRGVRVRLVLRYTAAGRFWPLFRAYPWAIDVRYPLGRPPTGSKAFDLPPGRTTRSWEGSPAIPGTILGLGGHLHDYGESLELRDVTTGELLWRGIPVTDGAGHVRSFPLARFYTWRRLGIRVTPAHRYRLTAVYENPTGRVIRDGGMGAVAGLFVPDRGAAWPAVDRADTLYRRDLAATLRAGSSGAMRMTGHHTED